ncbi:CNNM domain-containing protein, partial [Bacillus sp. D-CC]
MVLIALTAFFVAAEFAIVKVRSSRIDYLIAEGSNRATSVQILFLTYIVSKEKYLDIYSISIVIVLIALTAFFVAAEFAIVKVRSSRI